MEALLKKYFWIVKVLGLTVVVGLAASAVTTRLGASKIYVTGSGDGGDDDGGDTDGDTDGEDEEDDKKSPGAGLFDKASTTKAKPSNDRARSASDKTKQLTVLLKNNLFCPTCAPEIPEDDEEVVAVGAPVIGEDGEPLGGIQPGEQRTSLPLKLVVTMQSSIAKNSQATIFDTESGSVGPYWPGDQVRPGVYLVGVERGLIHLQNNASLEYLELGAEIAPPKKKAKKTEKKEEEKPKKGEIPGAEDAIKCDGETSCTIERAFVEQILSNPASLAKQARVVPSVVDGETRGFKFYGIRSGSLPKLLGLKNGDMITSVNGKDLKSMDDAMALYTKLRNAPNLSVTIDRKGKQMNKEITIK
ncbi:MAG: type II secretion system protein GspC [Nannocystaceae bacterium]